ncbi:Cro/C1-type HTH DNA-binding domain-containing protein [Apibacter mensalis]|uniref:Cro/C1-type HTH DNA-binding domain-containing protein n=1 Tax=Apibacter mensalis TaxID=1586267 RepID=A0A0X3APV9_9FLAO|nr:helix-turn-helix transcriptional regulator [Apibacter mensalis]CVK17169.1 Cro/C1-type HTH DNA-binding domain-containing protein [Apibacter mensalis]
MGLNIEKVLHQKGLNKAKLAELLGRKDNRSYVTNLLKSPSYASLEKIADVLGVDVKDLFDDTKDEDLTALIDYKGEFFRANTIEELQNIVGVIKEKTKI